MQGKKISEQLKKQIVQFSVNNGLDKTAKKFGYSTSSIMTWRKQLGVSGRYMSQKTNKIVTTLTFEEFCSLKQEYNQFVKGAA